MILKTLVKNGVFITNYNFNKMGEMFDNSRVFLIKMHKLKFMGNNKG